ncbi:MAG: malto-oligosyltrehalose trehalohydrolase [Betaproteobacteria bacterium]
MGTTHTMPFGATLIADGGVAFRLWAPAAEQIVLEHAAREQFTAHPMKREQDGWHRLELAQAGAGDSYRLRLPDGLVVPDPASRFNPNDVHGASQVIDPQAYGWCDTQWRGRAWHEAVVYELHIGTFTPEGTFAAARQRLPYLAEIGITAIELMPLADFPGKHGWGYDGVLLFAPEAAYGTPDELKALVDAAHALGLMVLLDVVYNHFGPEGNYLHAYCPQFFNPAHQTPWGAAINFDGAHAQTVRDFFIHNALYWVCEFHFDGLRMDAIHAIRDDSPRHIVRDICAALRNGPGRERQIHVVLENDLNQASLLAREPTGAPLCADAQWNDDIHHAGHVLLTGESDGYYCDYADAPLTRFAQALAGGFIYQGQASPFRDGALRGEPCTGLPLAAFVSFLQNHDQVGNRAMGERLVTLANPALVRAAQACILLSPHVPMLFMGEEFACSAPFLYFCDFGPELARQVSEGRRAEFGRFAAFASEAAQAAIPDPNDASSFLQSKLRWEELELPHHRQWRDDVRQWLAVRREHLFALLQGGSGAGDFSCDGADTMRVVWKLGGRHGTATAHLHLLAHFGAQAVLHERPMPGRTLVADAAVSESGGWRLAQGAVVLTLQEASHD